jgi:hypothetical protein
MSSWSKPGDPPRHRLTVLGEQNADSMRDSIRGIDQRRPLKHAVGRAHQSQHVLDAVPGHGEQHRIAPDDRLTRRDGEVLRELTGGAVFHDGLGLLDSYRQELTWYPDDVWRYILACQWMRLSQEEPFVGRCGEVGDDLGSAVVATRQVRDLMKLCLLMNRVYPPYSKWLGTAFGELSCAAALKPFLSAALAAQSWEERERHLVPAYEIAAGMHNNLGLTEPLEAKARYFHTRPFLVIDGYRFTDSLMTTINDPQVRALPPVGAIDQYIDSTDVTDRNFANRRRQYTTGPALTTPQLDK